MDLFFLVSLLAQLNTASFGRQSGYCACGESSPGRHSDHPGCHDAAKIERGTQPTRRNQRNFFSRAQLETANCQQKPQYSSEMTETAIFEYDLPAVQVGKIRRLVALCHRADTCDSNAACQSSRFKSRTVLCRYGAENFIVIAAGKCGLEI